MCALFLPPSLHLFQSTLIDNILNTYYYVLKGLHYTQYLTKVTTPLTFL